MPLPLPRLGDRRFDQLVDEGKALLPRLAPGWTDYNLHDPGITLIDLFAWLVEMDLYRLDRTSPAAYRAFLRLVGIEPRPPQVAETVLVFDVKREPTAVPVPAAVPLLAGVPVASLDGRTKFQTHAPPPGMSIAGACCVCRSGRRPGRSLGAESSCGEAFPAVRARSTAGSCALPWS